MIVPAAQAADNSQGIENLLPPSVIITRLARCSPPTAIVVVGLAEGGVTNPTPPTAATAVTVAIVVIAILPAAGTIASPARCPTPVAIVVVSLADVGATNPTAALPVIHFMNTVATAATITIIAIAILSVAVIITSLA